MNAAEAYDLIEAMLNAANVPGGPRVDVFVGDPSPKMDSDDRVHPYIAIWPGPGQLDAADEDLTGQRGSRVITFTATCAGGDVPRAMRAVVRCHQALVGSRLDPTTGFVFENGDGGNLRQDPTAAPARWYAPLLLAVAI